MVEKFIPNHLHFICKGECKNPLKNETELNDWLISLVEKVKMVVLTGPDSIYVDEPGNEGITGTITLSTSHASIHIWDKVEPPMFQFDIYSCKEFSSEEVIEHLNQFELTKLDYIRLDRNNGIVVTEQKTLNF